MALSDHEQEQLAELEEALMSEDPRFAHTMQGTRMGSRQRRGLAVAAVGVLAGIVLLVVGMQIHPAVSVIGFVVMLVFAVRGVMSWQQGDSEAPREHIQTPRPFTEHHTDDGF